MRKKIVIFGVIIVIMLLVCGCTEEKKSEPKDLEYQNTVYDFKIIPPNGWTVYETDPRSIVQFIGPTIEEFSVNFGIGEPIPLEVGESLEEMVLLYIELLPTAFTNFVEISNNSRTINGINAHEVVYTCTMEGDYVKYKQVFVEKNEEAFTITFIATSDTYDDYIDLFEESLGSFTFI